jgi:hypothetical protein
MSDEARQAARFGVDPGLKKEGLRSKRDAEQINLGSAPRAFHFIIVGSSPVVNSYSAAARA